MYPTLFQVNLPFIGVFNVYSYGLMLLLGVGFSIFLLIRRGTKLGYQKDFLIDFSFFVILTSFIGARIMYVSYYSEQFSWGIFKIWEDGGFNIPFAIFWVIAFYMIFTETIFKSIKSLVIYTLLIFVIFGRLVHILENYEYYNFEIFAIWKGGIIFYGGLAGGILGGIVFLLIKKENILKIADLTLPLVFLGLFFGRIGCFLRGCCWGRICTKDIPFCIRYPKDSLPYIDHLEKGYITNFDSYSLAVYPAQLIESIICLMLFLTFWFRFNRKKFDGQIAFEFLGAYAVERFIVEFLRGDMTKLFGLSFAQFISLPIIVIVIVLRLTLLAKLYAKKSINL
jgi:phosphatidylglycerol---prolipoprotein diacylglyceryl transferase